MSNPTANSGSAPTHDWQYVPFSSHHGWEHREYVCSRCHRRVKTDDEPPTEHCCLAWATEDENWPVTVWLNGQHHEITVRFARALAREILAVTATMTEADS